MRDLPVQEPAEVRDIVKLGVLDALRRIAPRHRTMACSVFAEEALLAIAFEAGPVVAAEVAYRVADLLATAGGRR